MNPGPLATRPPARPPQSATPVTPAAAAGGFPALTRRGAAAAWLTSLALLGSVAPSQAQLVGGSYFLVGQATAGGGRSTGETWELAGSIAVPVCAVSVGGSYVLNSGLVGAWPPPSAISTVQIERATGNVRILFTGTLQSAPSVAGPWIDVGAATSPHVVDPADAARFFRSRQ